MPSYKLVYFDLRGRGEIVRLCFHAAGVTFDEERIDYPSEWTAEKKAAAPFGELPYLEIDGKKFAQSGAIASYISREYGLYGDSALENLFIDGVVALTVDYFDTWVRSYFEEDANKKVELETKLKNEVLPKFLGHLEKVLTDSGSGFCSGQRLTLADLAVHHTLEVSYRDFPDIYANYPKVVENRKKVESLPRLKSYLSSRKVTEI
ncbi:probable glutathione S-transferase 5 [Patella vulgata]|uniref:probable glutathione S-transferase 5 n=1 Tax=Patella vulgata TaxID=6465 RepID=UPI0021801E2C|nr:probable glutathione S-transferase 5 [Patella vulgata]